MSAPDLYVLSVCYDMSNPGKKVYQVVSAHKTLRDTKKAIMGLRRKFFMDWYNSRGNNWNRGKFVKGEKFTSNQSWKITPLQFT